MIISAPPTVVPPPDYPLKLKPAITRYVMPGWASTGTLDKVVVAGTIYYVPIFVSETTTFDRIAIEVGTAAVGTADLRIFNWANGLPTSLLLSAGTVDTGAIGVKEIIIAQALSRGYYFLAYRCSATPTLKGLDYAQAASSPVGGLNTGFNLTFAAILSIFAAYADPAPAPTDPNFINAAAIGLREA